MARFQREKMGLTPKRGRETVSRDIEAEVTQILGRAVMGSRIGIDPLAGDAILEFLLEDTEAQAKSRAEG